MPADSSISWDEKPSSPTSPTTTTDETLVESPDTDIENGDVASRRASWLSRWLSKTTTLSRSSTADGDGEVEDAYSIETRNLETSASGYARIALFQSSDPNFQLYRGFNTLHCRVLSGLQHDIEVLERELDDLDEHDTENGKRKLKSKIFDRRTSSSDLASGKYPDSIRRTRPDVLKDLQAKLLEYDEFLLKTKDMSALKRPSKRDYESVRTWFMKEEPIVRKEAQFIRRKEDIVTLRVGRECAGFDGYLERMIGVSDRFLRDWFHISIIRYLFLTPELREKCKDDKVRYYSPQRIDTLVNIVITTVIFALLIVPVVVLYELTNLGSNQTALDAIGILIVFTLIFGMAISSMTTASRQELFGACAAYCAVLVVFIGNFGIQWVKVKGKVDISTVSINSL